MQQDMEVKLAVLETKLDSILTMMNDRRTEQLAVEEMVHALHQNYSNVQNWLRGSIATMLALSGFTTWTFTTYRDAYLSKVDFLKEVCTEVNEYRLAPEDYPRLCLVWEKRKSSGY